MKKTKQVLIDITGAGKTLCRGCPYNNSHSMCRLFGDNDYSDKHKGHKAVRSFECLSAELFANLHIILK